MENTLPIIAGLDEIVVSSGERRSLRRVASVATQISTECSAFPERPIDSETGNCLECSQTACCDSCHKSLYAANAAADFAYLTPNDFVVCSTCAEEESWQREELWPMRLKFLW